MTGQVDERAVRHCSHDRNHGPHGWVLESVDFWCTGTPATLTASEVKVLTETASKVAYALGRKDAGEEIAVALKRRRERMRGEGQQGWALLTEAWVIALDNASQPLSAASDATSGVPGHQEVSEAARSPQEPCGHPTCPCTSQEAR